MKIGDTIAVATCDNCHSRIKQIYYRDGGNMWEHENGSPNCERPRHAVPQIGSVIPMVSSS